MLPACKRFFRAVLSAVKGALGYLVTIRPGRKGRACRGGPIRTPVFGPQVCFPWRQSQSVPILRCLEPTKSDEARLGCHFGMFSCPHVQRQAPPTCQRTLEASTRAPFTPSIKPFVPLRGVVLSCLESRVPRYYHRLVHQSPRGKNKERSSCVCTSIYYYLLHIVSSSFPPVSERSEPRCAQTLDCDIHNKTYIRASLKIPDASSHNQTS